MATGVRRDARCKVQDARGKWQDLKLASSDGDW